MIVDCDVCDDLKRYDMGDPHDAEAWYMHECQPTSPPKETL